ncbi:MAG: sodium:proton antiporter [Candidatus Omnitrophica bacterium]|nr:sodium:proton antiporter [Candidatus Omnitrophota bacterium]
MNNQTGMSLIVKTITRLTVGLILIYGIYIMLQGHIGPGGGFAGGVIIALSFIHLILAFGRKAVFQKMNEARGLIYIASGALAFLLLSTLGFLGISGVGFMPFCDTAVALLVSSGLFVMFLVLIGLASKEKRI